MTSPHGYSQVEDPKLNMADTEHIIFSSLPDFSPYFLLMEWHEHLFNSLSLPTPTLSPHSSTFSIPEIYPVFFIPMASSSSILCWITYHSSNPTGLPASTPLPTQTILYTAGKVASLKCISFSHPASHMLLTALPSVSYLIISPDYPSNLISCFPMPCTLCSSQIKLLSHVQRSMFCLSPGPCT